MRWRSLSCMVFMLMFLAAVVDAYETNDTFEDATTRPIWTVEASVLVNTSAALAGSRSGNLTPGVAGDGAWFTISTTAHDDDIINVSFMYRHDTNPSSGTALNAIAISDSTDAVVRGVGIYAGRFNTAVANCTNLGLMAQTDAGNWCIANLTPGVAVNVTLEIDTNGADVTWGAWVNGVQRVWNLHGQNGPIDAVNYFNIHIADASSERSTFDNICIKNATDSVDCFPVAVSDTVFPSVVNVTTNGTGLNRTPTGSVAIKANATDNIGISLVLANITWPNLTTSTAILMLANGTTGEYVLIFNQTLIEGLYNITVIVNDTSNNVNRSGVTNFSILDQEIPAISQVNVTNNGTVAAVHNISATVTDFNISGVFMNVTLPNATTRNFTMVNVSTTYYLALNETVAGTYSFFIVANDSKDQRAISVNASFSIPTLLSSQVNLSRSDTGIPIAFYNHTLRANVTYSGANPANVTFFWFRNGNLLYWQNFTIPGVTTVANATLGGPGNFTHRDLINVTARATDTQGNIMNVTSITVNISNYPPDPVNFSSMWPATTSNPWPGVYGTKNATQVLFWNATDPDSDNMTFTIHTRSDFGNGGENRTMRNQSNSSAIWPPLNESSIYLWYVNATDGYNVTQGSTGYFLFDITGPQFSCTNVSAPCEGSGVGLSRMNDINMSIIVANFSQLNGTQPNDGINLTNVQYDDDVNISLPSTLVQVNTSAFWANVTWPNGTSRFSYFLSEVMTPVRRNLSINETPIEGTYNISLQGNDTLNNLGNQYVFHLNINDTRSPTLTNITVTNNGSVSSALPKNVSVDVTDYNRTNGVILVNITVPNGTTLNFTMLASASPNFYLGLNETQSGTYSAFITANDSKNLRTTSVNVSWNVLADVSSGSGGGGGSGAGTGTTDVNCVRMGLVAKMVNGSQVCVTQAVALQLDAIDAAVVSGVLPSPMSWPTLAFVGSIVLLISAFAGVTKRKAKKRKKEEGQS